MEVSSSAGTLKMISRIKGGNEESEAPHGDCRLTALNGKHAKCVKGPDSLKCVLMHELQGVLELQS